MGRSQSELVLAEGGREEGATVRERVLLVTNVPSPYRLELFERLNREFDEFFVVFQAEPETGRHWKTRPPVPFPTAYLASWGIRIGSRDIRLLTGLGKIYNQRRPTVVIGAGFSPSIAMLARQCARDRTPFILMNDGTTYSDPCAGIEFHYRRWLAKTALGAVAAASGGRAYFLRLGVPSARTVTVQLTRDLRRLREVANAEAVQNEARTRWGLGARVISFLGQFVPRKGPTDVLKAMAIVSAKEPSLWLVMAGTGPLEGELQRLANELGLERVRFVGHLPWEDVQQLLSVSELTILPSEHEPYGMVVMESLAAGAPVITTRQVGASADLIENGQTGFVVPLHAPEAIAESIMTFFRSDALRAHMREATARIVERYDIASEAAAFVQAVKQLTSTTRGSYTAVAGRVLPRRRVVIATKALTPYRLPLLDALESAGLPVGVVVGAADVDAIPPESARDLPHGVPIRWCPADGIIRWDVERACAEMNAGMLVVEHGARLGFAWTLLFGSALRGVPRVVWTHGIENRERAGGGRNLASRLRWAQLMRADGILCYDVDMANELSERFPGKPVYAAPNSTDGTAIREACGPDPSSRRDRAKMELGLHRQFYLLCLGRLVSGKRPIVVLDVLKHMQRAGLDVGAIFVGDGPQAGDLRRESARRGFVPGVDVMFLGEVRSQGSLAKWLLCCDIHVNAGYAGLNVVDVMFAGLPTVLGAPGPTGPFHSPEWRYLRNQPAGIFVQSIAAEALADSAAGYLRQSAEERRAVNQAIVAFASENLGVHKMVDGFTRMARALGCEGER